MFTYFKDINQVLGKILIAEQRFQGLLKWLLEGLCAPLAPILA
jgi:hypothetical protein